jgi:hypothetical protein
MEPEIFDDDARFEDRAVAVNEDREPLYRPAPLEIGKRIGIGVVEQAVVEVGAVFIKRRQRLLERVSWQPPQLRMLSQIRLRSAIGFSFSLRAAATPDARPGRAALKIASGRGGSPEP